MGSIYKLTCIPSGKSYIGQTYRKVESRIIKEHFGSGSTGCVLLEKAIKKYGKDAFTYEILHDGIIPELLDSYEIEAIKEHNTLVPNGYNLQTGGSGGSWSEESREKMRGENNPHYGKPAWNKGKPHPEKTRKKIRKARKNQITTAETRKKMSESQTGENNSFYGKTHTPEACKKISESNKGKPAWNKGKPFSKEARKKMSESKKGMPSSFKGKSHSAETRRKMSESQRGKKHSKEHRQKISEANKGNTRRLGHKHSIETRRKISKSGKHPMHEPSKKYYFSLPAKMNLTEKRKRVKEFSGNPYPTVCEWIRKWKSES